MLLHTLNSRLLRQAQGTRGRPDRYSGVVDCFRKTLAEEGVRGLYRGIGPNFAKAVPAMAISYAVFEFVKKTILAADARLGAVASSSAIGGTGRRRDVTGGTGGESGDGPAWASRAHGGHGAATGKPAASDAVAEHPLRRKGGAG